MTMTSTYDHRIIQGAESGRFLGLIESYLQGEEGFYEEAFEALGAKLAPLSAPPAAEDGQAPVQPQPDGAPARIEGAVDEELLQAVQAASTMGGRVRSHGHLAARLDPLGSEPEGDPGLIGRAGPDAAADGAPAGGDLPDIRDGRELRGCAGAPA